MNPFIGWFYYFSREQEANYIVSEKKDMSNRHTDFDL